MKILLIGYGKMGKAIERLATARGHEIVGRVDDTNPDLLHTIPVSEVDIAIEFTRPEAAFENISTCLKRGIKVISGTTGWLDRFDEVKAQISATNGTFLYASNFSLGVNLFFALNKKLSKLMADYELYEPTMEEIHHTQKLDAPSGTAITLAEGLMEQFTSKKQWVNEESDNIEDLSIISKRIDKVPGTHSVTWHSEMDEITIQHTAHTRDSFAIGAILVANWIKDQVGFFTMEDFMCIEG